MKHGKEIKIDRLYKLRILVAGSFFLILGGALALIISWAVVFKPFEKFEHYEAQLIFGNTFDIDEVNIVRIGESISPYLYEFHYEIDGKVYVQYWKVWNHDRATKSTAFDYLVTDPSYTVASRTFALIAFPIAFVLLCLAEVALIKIYLKERKRFINYNKKPFG